MIPSHFIDKITKGINNTIFNYFIAFVVVHPSLLPKYRGASPIQFALLNDDKITGVTYV
jgi:methionyl-tRNA formyltransferase